jgi:uncharacterized protein YbjT (DUF2867 family)|tara:strand:+ start:230 stop:1636 length:1407 start_codon:yes stop_codon:yes gene_type:complete
MGTILVTGATGYIGGRLVPELLARGYDVRVMVRETFPDQKERWPNAQIVVADALDPSSLREALDGVHSAYYLIHSLPLGQKKFEFSNIQAAINFGHASAKENVKRIIYLEGLGDTQMYASVPTELKREQVDTTVLRATSIFGSGSASFELLTHLVANLRILFAPYWARSECQAISVRDVIKYLVGVLETPATHGKTFDIGGRDLLTYATMLRTIAAPLDRKILIVPFPISWIRAYSYLANLITPVPGPIITCLLDRIENRAICQNDDITRLVPFETLSFKETLLAAIQSDEQDNVQTRWSDAYPRDYHLQDKLHEMEAAPFYTASASLLSSKTESSLFQSICMIGGDEGWFNSDWMWRLRGIMDRVLLGVGTLRGRRSATKLRVNDVIDFWRVEDLEDDRRLLLRAEMKLPGWAWLEFRIEGEDDKNRLSVNAYYEPKGLAGKLYWYIFLPFHSFIFKDLIKQIEKRG